MRWQSDIAHHSSTVTLLVMIRFKNKCVVMGRHLFTADYTCFRTTFMTKSNAFV